MPIPESRAGVVAVERLEGAEATADTPPTLLVEVPHGADQRAHYDALHARMMGSFPAGLEIFFHVNTDEGAWDYGRATAEQVLAACPGRAALLVRSLIPRTFIDCNRPADFEGSDLTKGGLSSGMHTYVHDERDRALLRELHASYIEAAAQAFAAVCGNGGVALVPHTYSPRSVGIPEVDDSIVEKLRAAYVPDVFASWPERAAVDLLTRDGEGRLLAPEGAEEELIAAFAAAGFEARCNDTYFIHPASLGHRWSTGYPGQVLCLELRRDLVIPAWRPFEENTADPEQARLFASILAPTLVRLLGA